ncbi:MAG: hypothetical protein ACKO0Z_24850, partial [Betaproteobacteria bacterium]
YKHHNTTDDCAALNDLPQLVMTAGDYDRLVGGALSDEVGEDTRVTIHPDNTYTIGDYDGNQYGESLI